MENRLKLQDINKMYGVSINFLRTMMCRCEFTKYMKSRNNFIDCPEFHQQIREHIKLKLQNKRCKLKLNSPTG